MKKKKMKIKKNLMKMNTCQMKMKKNQIFLLLKMIKRQKILLINWSNQKMNKKIIEKINKTQKDKRNKLPQKLVVSQVS